MITDLKTVNNCIIYYIGIICKKISRGNKMKVTELNDLQREYIDIVLRGKPEERTKECNERVKFLYNELRKRGQLTNTIRLLKELRR